MLIGLRDRFDTLDATLRRTAGTFCRPDDGPETRLQKTLLVLSSILFSLAGVIWGAIYLLAGETVAGSIPLSYALISSLSLIYFAVTKRFKPYRLSQILLILLLPTFLMISLGGFRTGSAVILWAVVAPLGALLFASRTRAHIWLGIYLLILASMGVLEPYLPARNNLPPWMVTTFFVLNIGAVTVVFYLVLNHFVSERDRIRGLLEQEREKSERLLLNVLPEEIAPQLKENQTVAARFDSASVLFADLVGFTHLSAEMSAESIVQLLNEIVSNFDSLTDAHGAEKIRTIGDSYMVAAGVPVSRPDHAETLADLALEMRKYLNARNQRAEQPVQVRMGMATGSMIGAVIGSSKFHYDVWGNAVNLASRLEAHGKPGQIQISAETQRHLRDRFTCRYRGELELKGFETVETWFLEGRGTENN